MCGVGVLLLVGFGQPQLEYPFLPDTESLTSPIPDTELRRLAIEGRIFVRLNASGEGRRGDIQGNCGREE
jgi:hypothetical protein